MYARVRVHVRLNTTNVDARTEGRTHARTHRQTHAHSFGRTLATTRIQNSYKVAIFFMAFTLINMHCIDANHLHTVRSCLILFAKIKLALNQTSHSYFVTLFKG